MSLDILAGEDDRDALANLRDILELDGYRVTGLGTIREAADRLRRPAADRAAAGLLEAGWGRCLLPLLVTATVPSKA